MFAIFQGPEIPVTPHNFASYDTVISGVFEIFSFESLGAMNGLEV